MAAPIESELKFYHCEERSALSTNGGRISTTEVITKVINNVWPHVLRAEREAGQTLYRKLALKIHQDDTSGSLATTEFCFDGPTLGEDRCIIFPAGAQDTQADITGSERIYCAGSLHTAITAGAQTIVFDIKDAADAAGIVVADTVRLTDKLTPEATSGNIEYLTVATKSVSGTEVTITTEEVIGNDYAAYSSTLFTGGKIGVVCPAGETKYSYETPVITSTAGTFDDTTYPVIANNMGADEQEFTFEITDGSGNFICTSDRFGSLASGNISTDYTALHPTWAKSMITIDASAWGGTWADGDTLVIQFHAAASYVWEKRIVPADCAPMSSNRVILCNRSEGL